MSVTYRSLTASDHDFCVQVHHLAMRSYVEPLWGWDQALQDRLALDFTTHEDPCHEIALVDDAPIGFLSYQRRPDRIYLNKLYLHPNFHGKGFGSQILLRMIRHADATATPIELSVLTTNVRARAFYERHGFLTLKATPERVLMRRAVGAPLPA
jgi:ribosomal protein S18 acetylase RimI-like enzyme